jgi:hypothetical protein
MLGMSRAQPGAAALQFSPSAKTITLVRCCRAAQGADMGPETAWGRVASGEVWEEFCDRLKDLGKVILRPEAPCGEIDRAEGWHYLSRLTRMALEVCFENSDPDFPTFLNIPNATAKAGADNPDNLCFVAAIAGDREYRLQGTRGTVAMLAFNAVSLVPQRDSTTGQAIAVSSGSITDKNLIVNPDGTFEIAVSRERRPGNWLPLAADSGVLRIRQTFRNKND